MSEKARKAFSILVSNANALYHMYYYMHWKSSGENYYADHLLYERLYDDLEDELDSLAEKAIGIMNDTHAIMPTEDMKQTSKILSLIMSDKDTASDFPDIAIKAEHKFIKMIDDVSKVLQDEEKLTGGIEDLFQAIQNKHEEHLYLLQQRNRKQANSFVKLYKLAYVLDQKAQYEEAKKIEEVMKAMAERTGLSKSNMISLADYFDRYLQDG